MLNAPHVVSYKSREKRILIYIRVTYFVSISPLSIRLTYFRAWAWISFLFCKLSSTYIYNIYIERGNLPRVFSYFYYLPGAITIAIIFSKYLREIRTLKNMFMAEFGYNIFLFLYRLNYLQETIHVNIDFFSFCSLLPQ